MCPSPTTLEEPTPPSWLAKPAPPKPRPMHPIIRDVRARDKALRDQGKRAGLWSPEEAAEVMQTGVTNIYELLRNRQIEHTTPFGRGAKNGSGITSRTRRITSNGIIAFVEANTHGPDEDLVCGNLEAVIRTLSVDALLRLKDYIEKRVIIVTNGGPLMPRARRSLKAALEPRPDDGHPDLFENKEQKAENRNETHA